VVEKEMSRAKTNQLIEQIKIELNEKGYDNSVLGFGNDTDVGYEDETAYFEIAAELAALRRNYYVNSGVRSASLGIKWKIKKAIEKVVGLYVKPIVNDQNLYNINLLQALEKMSHIIERQESEIAQLRQKLSEADENKEI